MGGPLSGGNTSDISKVLHLHFGQWLGWIMKLPEAEPSGYLAEENFISSFMKTLGFHTFLFYPRGRAQCH